MRCLAGLPPEQREVIVLKFWHGRTFEEIGTLLGISPNTAAGRYRYGIRRLKACMQEASHEMDAHDGIVDASPALAAAATSALR
jgi:RNA polymerase sigma-70 factor (ECF subfamily)